MQRPSFSGLLSGVSAEEFEAPKIWAAIKAKVVVQEVPAAGSCRVPVGPRGELPPKRRETDIRVMCISDTHTAHRLLDGWLPPPVDERNDANRRSAVDLLLHAGDFTDVGQERDIAPFAEWLAEIRPRFRHGCVVIAGNHDLSLDYKPGRGGKKPYYDDAVAKRFGHTQRVDSGKMEALLRSSCHYLMQESVTFPALGGLKIYGEPSQPWFYDWAWNTARTGESHATWAAAPTDADIILTHGPAMGHGDRCVPSNDHFGCESQLDWVEKHAPKLVVAGHLHEDGGMVTTNGRTVFVNASSLDEKYNLERVRVPVVIDLPCPNRAAAAGPAESH